MKKMVVTKFFKLFTLFGWILCCMFNLQVLGEDDTIVAEIFRLDDLVVVGTSHERELVDTPYTTYLLNENDIKLRLQPKGLPDSLESIPGVLLQKTGHGMTSPFLRGVTSQRILLIADGVRVNNSYLREGPNQYWNQVNGFFYDNLEVLMGPASVLYGSDAIGGVVNAYSTPMIRGAAGDGLVFQENELLFRYSSAEDSYSEHAESQLSINDRWGIRLGLTRQDFGELHTGDDTDNPNTEYEQWGLNLRIQYWLSDEESVIVGYDHFDQDDVDRVHRTVEHVDFHGTSTKGGTSDLDRIFDHDRKTVFTRFEKREGIGWFEEIDAGFSYTFFEENFKRIRGDGRQQLRETDFGTLGLYLRLQSPSKFGTWTYGVDYYHDFVDTSGDNVAANGDVTELIQGLVADDADYELLGFYLQDEYEISHRWEVIAGGRYTYAQLKARQVDFGGEAGTVKGDWDALTGSLRLIYRAVGEDRLNLFSGVSQGFRAPNLSDATRLGEFGGGDEVPTADLDSESFTTFELGAKSSTDWGQLAITGFYTDIKDRIRRVSEPESTKRNLDDGFIQGVEGNVLLRLPADLSFFGSIAWQEGKEDNFRDRDLTQDVVERPISRMLPLTSTVGIRWEPAHNNFWAEFYVDMADNQDRLTDNEKNDNRFPPGGTPGYTIYNLRGGYRLHDHLNFTLALENLSDKEYRIHGSGVNEPGRNLIFTVAMKL